MFGCLCRLIQRQKPNKKNGFWIQSMGNQRSDNNVLSITTYSFSLFHFLWFLPCLLCSLLLGFSSLFLLLYLSLSFHLSSSYSPFLSFTFSFFLSISPFSLSLFSFLFLPFFLSISFSLSLFVSVFQLLPTSLTSKNHLLVSENCCWWQEIPRNCDFMSDSAEWISFPLFLFASI